MGIYLNHKIYIQRLTTKMATMETMAMWNENTILMLDGKCLAQEAAGAQAGDDGNWERIYIKGDKFKGSLRYARSKKDAEEAKFPELFRNLNLIEVQDEKQEDGYYHASLISLTKPKERKKNSCKKTEPAKEQQDEEPLAPELERDVIARIKAAEKVALQMIKISLEEAQSDRAELGRPLTFTVHDGHHLSLLSAGAPPPKADASVQLIGMVNLLGLLLITSNVHKVLHSIEQYG